jgi:hypothetical protein
MIDSDLHVSESDGTPVVVDATGDEVVCRRLSPHSHGTYHRIDCERYEHDGTIHPVCHVTGATDTKWRPVRLAPIEEAWAGCDYKECYGEYDLAAENRQRATGSHLRTTLTEMSVEEFDATVAAHNGGER